MGLGGGFCWRPRFPGMGQYVIVSVLPKEAWLGYYQPTGHEFTEKIYFAFGKPPGGVSRTECVTTYAQEFSEKGMFLSPPVHVARWAHRRRFLSICLSVKEIQTRIKFIS